MRSKYVQYYVEGEDEEKLINTLKTDLGVIRSGKVQRFNVIQNVFSPPRLMTLQPKTMAVLIFDTDTGQVDKLNENLSILKKCPAISEVAAIPQVPKLEQELIRSCDIKRIVELLNSRSRKDFKSDLIQVTNLAKKLQQHHFDIRLFWSADPPSPYQDIGNQSKLVKIIR